MFLVGLTGGIGSGKSTVAGCFRGRGWPVIDADVVAREVVEPGEATLDRLAEHFGPGILRPDGSLDRHALAQVAFADAASRAELDRLTHPAIAARIAERLARLEIEERGTEPSIAVVDHPLLIETGQVGRFDAVVVVLADEATRLDRLVRLRGLDADDARARMRAQVDDEARRAAATHVVINEGSLAELEEAARSVASAIEAAARESRGARSW